MSSGYNQYDPNMIRRASEAPKWAGAQPDNRNDWQRRDANRIIERELKDIQTPLPMGMEMPQAPPNMQPLQNDIRGLIQRLRGQVPTPAGPPPQQEQAPEQPMRSVLRRG